jgi:uncharacterized RDD family membrane protein YckC
MEFWEDFETLRIETPEGLDLFLPLAGFGPRFLAFLIDSLIIGVAQALLIFILIMTSVFGAVGMGSSGSSPDFAWLFILMLVLFLLVALLAPILYFAIFETIWAGQTPGKRTAGIRVIRRGGYPAGRREIFTRNVMRIVDMLPSNWMVGVVSFFATHNQQRVGDLVADTVVVREFAGRQPLSQSTPSFEKLYGGSTAAAPGTLTPALSYIIGSYIQRAHELDVYAREHLTLRCIEALGYNGQHLSLTQRESYLASVIQSAWAAQQ